MFVWQGIVGFEFVTGIKFLVEQERFAESGICPVTRTRVFVYFG